MTGPELCEKCKGLHYKNAPCIVRKQSAPPKIIEQLNEHLTALRVEVESKRPRGRPKTITNMAAYKAMKQREYRARKKASAEERDE